MTARNVARARQTEGTMQLFPPNSLGGAWDYWAIRRRTRVILVAIALTLTIVPTTGWAAEDIISGLSTELIQIRSDFTGTDIVIFGAVEGTEADTAPLDHNIVVVLRGPDTNLAVRRKERMFGLWVNRDQIVLSDMPGYYFLASTRPIEEMAPPNLLRRLQLGGSTLGTPVESGIGAEDVAAFQTAAVRNLAREQLYGEAPGGIEFLSATLFRARIPVPANVPPGGYNAEVYLFRTGALVSLQSSPLFVDKTGLERRVYELAYAAPLAYGLVAVFMAFAFGWLGFALFRPR